jgi:hypothetical protein
LDFFIDKGKNASLNPETATSQTEEDVWLV